jgi:hypothetical protein
MTAALAGREQGGRRKPFRGAEIAPFRVLARNRCALCPAMYDRLAGSPFRVAIPSCHTESPLRVATPSHHSESPFRVATPSRHSESPFRVAIPSRHSVSPFPPAPPPFEAISSPLACFLRQSAAPRTPVAARTRAADRGSGPCPCTPAGPIRVSRVLRVGRGARKPRLGRKAPPGFDGETPSGRLAHQARDRRFGRLGSGRKGCHVDSRRRAPPRRAAPCQLEHAVTVATSYHLLRLRNWIDCQCCSPNHGQQPCLSEGPSPGVSDSPGGPGPCRKVGSLRLFSGLRLLCGCSLSLLQCIELKLALRLAGVARLVPVTRPLANLNTQDHYF